MWEAQTFIRWGPTVCNTMSCIPSLAIKDNPGAHGLYPTLPQGIMFLCVPRRGEDEWAMVPSASCPLRSSLSKKIHSVDTPRDVSSKVVLVETVTLFSILLHVLWNGHHLPLKHLLISVLLTFCTEKVEDVLRYQKYHTHVSSRRRSQQILHWT